MLFVSAKVSHLGLLPQGEVEADSRALNMVKQMDLEGFGNCSNITACKPNVKRNQRRKYRQIEPRIPWRGQPGSDNAV
ncbi:MAG: hypothetical protein R2769_10605 [Saprospiraceae bacterium]